MIHGPSNVKFKCHSYLKHYGWSSVFMICILYYHIKSVVTHPTEVIKDQCNHAIKLSHQETQKDNHLFMITDCLKEFTSLQNLE